MGRQRPLQGHWAPNVKAIFLVVASCDTLHDQLNILTVSSLQKRYPVETRTTETGFSGSDCSIALVVRISDPVYIMRICFQFLRAS